MNKTKNKIIDQVKQVLKSLREIAVGLLIVGIVVSVAETFRTMFLLLMEQGHFSILCLFLFVALYVIAAILLVHVAMRD